MSERERLFTFDLSTMRKPFPSGYWEVVECGLLSFDGRTFTGSLQDFPRVKEMVEQSNPRGVDAAAPTFTQWIPPEQEQE